VGLGEGKKSPTAFGGKEKPLSGVFGREKGPTKAYILLPVGFCGEGKGRHFPAQKMQAQLTIKEKGGSKKLSRH